ncbi:MAG: glycosyltransferase family 2 protein [Phocaeicola sp.]|nr:glycosyltransferase family 2 protein [Phocaeicola sp.]
MTTPLISVIVPVYRAENYISRCIDSLLKQTFHDFEILLIDDGSPDKSGDICDEYAKKDYRINVFHKKNGGVSEARQLGIDNAKGEYSIHVDPDDWVEPNMLELLYNEIKKNNADIVISDFFIERKDKTIYVSQKIETNSSRDVLIQLLNGTLHGSCCNKLIKHSCYKKYNIIFPLDIIRWEDLYVCCELLYNNIKVTYISKAFYHYDCFTNENSIIRKVNNKGFYSQIKFIEHFEKLFSKDPILLSQLYFLKTETLRLGFNSGILNINELNNLYIDIHNRFKEENKKIRFKNPSSWCTCLAFNHYKLARIIYLLITQSVLLLSKLKHIIYKR